MTEQRIFRPEEAIHFHSFRRQVEVFPLFIRYFRARLKKVHAKQAFYEAWKKINKNGDDALPSKGADDFWELMVSMLFRTQEFIRDIKKDYLRTYSDELEGTKQAENTLDPIALINLYEEHWDVADPLRCRIAMEARRNLILASQFAMIALADPAKRVSDDVVEIDKIAYQLVFAQESQLIHTVYVINKRKHGRLVGEPIPYALEEDANIVFERERESALDRQHAIRKTFPCRVIHDGEKTYYVLVDDRPKGPHSRLMKYERQSSAPKPIRDSRGSLYVVAAVEEPVNGHGERLLRLANRDDAQSVMQFVIDKMWSSDTMIVEEIPKPDDKSERDPDYWDVKFIGRYLYPDPEEHRSEERWLEVLVEQKVTTLPDFLNEKHATDKLNHEIRRGFQVLKLLDLYWPAQIYGVDWKDPEVEWQLNELWKEQLRLKEKKERPKITAL